MNTQENYDSSSKNHLIFLKCKQDIEEYEKCKEWEKIHDILIDCDITLKNRLIFLKCKRDIEEYHVEGFQGWERRDDGFDFSGVDKGFIYTDYTNSIEMKNGHAVYIRIYANTGHWYIGVSAHAAWERHCGDMSKSHRKSSSKIYQFYRDLLFDEPVMILTIALLECRKDAIIIEKTLIKHFSNPFVSTLPVNLCLNTQEIWSVKMPQLSKLFIDCANYLQQMMSY